MNVKQLKEFLKYAHETDEVALYDYATDKKILVKLPDVIIDVKGVVKINFDSTILK